MKIFFAGATGAIGALVLPRLVRDGHDVTAIARSREKADAIEAIGAHACLVDPLDRTALVRAVTSAQPQLILHQLTALAQMRGDFKRFDEEFALTNRFRTEVTDTLLDAARKVGTERLVAQSFCGWPFARVGGPIKSEADPLDPDPPREVRKTLAAIRYLEDRLMTAENVQTCVLRYGLFYGPGTGLSATGPLVDLVRKRRFPIVGRGTGIWSFIHIEDAAEATVAAITNRAAGLFNIVDDEPAPVSEWLPYLAHAVGAKKPLRMPVWLARPLIGEAGVSMMLQARGGSNEKAKRILGWQPRYKSWRTGFVEGLGQAWH